MFRITAFCFSSTRLNPTVSETRYVQYTLWLSQRGQQVGFADPINLALLFPGKLQQQCNVAIPSLAQMSSLSHKGKAPLL